jgi:hypothetical protein
MVAARTPSERIGNWSQRKAPETKRRKGAIIHAIAYAHSQTELAYAL